MFLVVRETIDETLWKLTCSAVGTYKKLIPSEHLRGSPNHIAPEIEVAEKNVSSYTNRVDIWALGCILYELCTGKRAFPGARSDGILAYWYGLEEVPQVAKSGNSQFSNLPIQLTEKEQKTVQAMWKLINSLPHFGYHRWLMKPTMRFSTTLLKQFGSISS